MSSISESWDRIHRWLERHAPKILASLNPGASTEEIAAVENTLGMALPVDWRELYCIHNGINDEKNHGSLFHGMNFFDLNRVVSEMVCALESANDSETVAVTKTDNGIRRDDMHRKEWIPLAHDWGEVLLRVDLAPDLTGTFGQIIFTDYAYNIAGLVAPSISAFLNDFANDLEGGRYFLNPDAIQDGAEFLSCVSEIDVINWWMSPQWKHLERSRGGPD